jgi:hypothetical protein
MKWFHHECSAKHDPRLQILGAAFGAQGLGVYWGVLEEIGQHSDTFHLKVTDISDEVDHKFEEFCMKPNESSETISGLSVDLSRVPRFPVKILAKVLFTTPKRLRAIIEQCVQVGLFDRCKWLTYNILYSPSFEQRADDYTRRQQRRSDIVRTNSGECSDTVRTLSDHSTDTLRTKSDKVLLEQSRTEQIQKEKRTEQTAPVPELSTRNPQSSPLVEEMDLEPSDEVFADHCKSIRTMIASWNQTHTQRFEWAPSLPELKRLFYEGDTDERINLCCKAEMNRGEVVTYPSLVIHAVRLMLEASERSRITNPIGWLWTCLHGRGDGAEPWVLRSASPGSRAPP